MTTRRPGAPSRPAPAAALTPSTGPAGGGRTGLLTRRVPPCPRRASFVLPAHGPAPAGPRRPSGRLPAATLGQRRRHHRARRRRAGLAWPAVRRPLRRPAGPAGPPVTERHPRGGHARRDDPARRPGPLAGPVPDRPGPPARPRVGRTESQGVAPGRPGRAAVVVRHPTARPRPRRRRGPPRPRTLHPGWGSLGQRAGAARRIHPPRPRRRRRAARRPRRRSPARGCTARTSTRCPSGSRSRSS
jgi:hypothetical protein